MTRPRKLPEFDKNSAGKRDTKDHCNESHEVKSRRTFAP